MFEFKNVYITDWFSVVGPNEKNNLKKYDVVMNDYYYNEKTIEKAEIKMQNIVLNYLTKVKKPDLIIGSDLSNQLTTTSVANMNRDIPFIGLYSACASSIGGLITMANLIDNKRIKDGIYITSSHNLNSEKQFRYPIEYGAPKPSRSTFTATGSVGISLSKNEGKIKIINGTLGCIVDSYVKDAYNMGAVMAPSAVDTLIKHLEKTKTTVNDYDLILSGDLGLIGEKIFKELLKQNNIKVKNYMDSGTLLYNNINYAGASGPVVLPMVLLNNIIYNKKYKKILLLATGSLHSPSLVNQKNTIPAVTHALTIEVIR